MALPGETLALGADRVCDRCGVDVLPRLGVYRSGAGWYIGTYCDCGPYTRESGYYPTREAAQSALKTNDYFRP